MPEYLHQTINIILAVLAFALLLLPVIQGLRNKYGRIKTVKATVCHKQKVEGFSKYRGSGKATSFVVTFDTGKKHLYFNVPEFSYHGYRVGERGTLKYRGKWIIDFH